LSARDKPELNLALIKKYMIHKTKCAHKHIVITQKSYYTFSEGYNKAMEKDDLDMTDYLIESDQEIVFCEDCGEYLTD